MSRKMYALLLPVVAIAAMAMTAGAAQALPHWFSCQKKGAGSAYSDSECQKKVGGEWEWVKLPETPKTQVISFGQLTLTSGTVKIRCKVLNAGNVWNPAAGGLDEIEVFINYECETLGTTVCNPVGITAKGFTWPTELIEVGGKPFDKIGSGAKPIEVTATCGALMIPFKGTLSPKVVNPTETEPLHFEFTATTGELEGPEGAKGKVEGNVRVLGFLHGEQIEVH